MIKRTFTLAGFFITALSSFSQHSVRIIINSLPEFHPSDSGLYIAGSFNGWSPRDENYRFQKDAKGNHFFETKLADGMHEFKITRGSWDKVECKKGGADIQNRSHY